MYRLFPLTIFLSAFLLFLVQPLIGKQVVPWFGGSAGVWTVCLAFFQLVLLAGYGYADLMGRFAIRRQMQVHLGVLLLALLTLPILANPALKPLGDEDPTGRLMLLLAATIGLPYFAVSSTGPLIQNWFATVTPKTDARRERVYRLFALSNLASLFALMAYPFAIEPFMPVKQQAWVWSGLFVLFALLCGASAVMAARAVAAMPPPAPVEPDAYITHEPPTAGRYLLWFTLSALGCIMLVTVSTHITQNVASVPFLWILPLALYLLTFILCFDSDRWYRRGLFQPLLMVLVPAMAWGLFTKNTVLPFWQAVPLYCGGLFVICMFCHGELSRAKPAPEYLTRFYLMISLGGAVGGLLVGLVAPRVFNAYWELPLALLLAALMLFVVMRDEGWVKPLFSLLTAATFGFAVWWWFWHVEANPFETEAMRNAVVAIIGLAVVALFLGISRSISGTAATLGLIAAVMTASFGWQYREVFTRDVIAMDRNFYGTVRVRQSPDGTDRKLTHGVILHGQQFLDEERRRWPTTYYSSTSGAGVALEALRQARKRPLKVGLIGLGVGTLATWGQPGDQFRFYEINPQVIDLAKRDFTYLKDSRATVTTALGDARLVLEREAPQGFDLLVVDAFTSDAIPVHLVTKEAMATYARQLAPGGIVAFHVSNRYLDLVPVVAGIAAANNMSTVKIADERAEWYLSRTDYVLATPDTKTLALKPIAERAEAVVPRAGFATWTDDYNNLFAILKR